MAKRAAPSKALTQEFNQRLLICLVCAAAAVWLMVVQDVSFTLGGDRDAIGETRRRGLPLAAHGLSAVMLGVAVLGFGIVNLALGIRSNQRRAVFWCGAAMMGAAILYAVGLVVMEIYTFITQLQERET